jgi:hypothetical protein
MIFFQVWKVKWCNDGRTFVTYSGDLTSVTRWTVHGDSVPEDSNPVLFEGNSKYFFASFFFFLLLLFLFFFELVSNYCFCGLNLLVIIIPPLPEGAGGYTVLPLSVQNIFCRTFLSNC